jgi:N-acetylglucosaminyldiphosphoundecaprenol N-acetyl-beta-D-mannosaminyltransferase
MFELREPRVAILGVAVDNLTMEEVLNAVEAKIAERGFHQIATANVDFLVNSVHDDELRETLARCDIVLADGMPLVWASRLLGMKLKQRVAGADLVPELARLSARNGYRIFLLGSDEQSSAGAAAWMQKNFPNVCIAGRHCPKFQPLEEMNHEDILLRIEEAQPDILLVAFGNPKQEKWLAMHRHRLKVPVCIGVGGSLDFLSGRTRRAPLWAQRSGIEWVYRIIQEPSRLAMRYANNAAGLLRYLPMQVFAMGLQKQQHVIGQITTESVDFANIVRIEGNFTSSLISRFESHVRGAIFSGAHIVLDMSRTAYIGADGLGSLIYIMNLARCYKRELWLAAVQPPLLRVITASQLSPSFRLARSVAEALRRIEPELISVPQLQQSPALFWIRGQLVPVDTVQMPELYHQIQLLTRQRMGSIPG